MSKKPLKAETCCATFGTSTFPKCMLLCFLNFFFLFSFNVVLTNVVAVVAIFIVFVVN